MEIFRHKYKDIINKKDIKKKNIDSSEEYKEESITDNSNEDTKKDIKIEIKKETKEFLVRGDKFKILQYKDDDDIYEPPNLRGYKPQKIEEFINELVKKKNIKSDVYIDPMDSDSDNQIDNVTIINNLKSNKIFFGGSLDQSLKNNKSIYFKLISNKTNKLLNIKKELDKIKLLFPEYYYLNGGFKLDNGIEDCITTGNLNKIDKLIKNYKKFKLC